MNQVFTRLSSLWSSVLFQIQSQILQPLCTHTVNDSLSFYFPGKRVKENGYMMHLAHLFLHLPCLPAPISYHPFSNSESVMLYMCAAHTSSFKDRQTEQSPVCCPSVYHQPRAAMEIFMWSLGDGGKELKHNPANSPHLLKWITLPQVHQPFLLYRNPTILYFFLDSLACCHFCGSSFSL